MEKRGLTLALVGAGVVAGDAVWHADELRLGLRGTTRRVLAPCGVKVTQRVQMRYEWRYLLLDVEPVSGRLWWRWVERMRGEQIAPVLAGWGWDAVVWDGAGAHRGRHAKALTTTRITLPPYSPELDPAERVFEEVRRQVESVVYADLDAKQAAVDGYLTGLAAEPERVKRLCGWAWLTRALTAVPSAP